MLSTDCSIAPLESVERWEAVSDFLWTARRAVTGLTADRFLSNQILAVRFARNFNAGGGALQCGLGISIALRTCFAQLFFSFLLGCLGAGDVNLFRLLGSLGQDGYF